MQYFSRESIGSMEGDLHQVPRHLAGVAETPTVVPVVWRPECSTTPLPSPAQAGYAAVRPLGDELRARDFRVCAKSHMGSSEGISGPARCALSHRYRAVSQRFVPKFVPK